MNKFKDTQDREWTITWTAADIFRVRAGTEAEVSLPDMTRAMYKDGPTLFNKLHSDVCFLLDIIWVMISAQAKTLNVSKDDFLASLGDEQILAARKVFWGTALAFFQKFDPSTAALILKMQEAEEGAMRQSCAAIASIDIEKNLAALRAKMNQAITNFSLNMPPSPESTQGPTP